MRLSSRLLKKLFDYGDSFLDDSSGTTRSDASKLGQKSRRSNADKRRKCITAATKLTEIERMRLELGLDEVCSKPAADAQSQTAREDRVPSTVVFRDPTKRKVKKRHLEEKNTRNDIPQEVNEISFKKARHDVLKFGIRGLDKPKQEEAKIALAVQLGAKPPKNDYLNYKELINDRKEKKVKEREERITNAKMGLKPKRQGNVRQRKTHVHHEGVHYVSKELISQVKQKKAK